MRKFLMLFAMSMLCGVLAFAQTQTVTGTVTDDAGAAVPYATVTETGTRNATTADASGNFSIKMRGSGSLNFTATGFNGVKVTPANGVASASLKRNSAELSTVTITGYGIRRDPKSLGTSIAKIDNKDLTQGKVTNIATGLSGKVSGLQITNTNSSVNQDTRITLRGNRSILGNNQALVVIDDIVMSRDQGGTLLAQLNPNDVETISILKGGSASAIYGSDGSNGVIIVTTKKGVRGKPTINYSNTTEVQEIAYLPKLQNTFGQYGGELSGDGVFYFPENPVVPYVSYENQNYGPRFNGQPIIIGAPVRFYRADGTYFDSLQHGTYSAKPNAKLAFFNKGITEQNDLSISGGDDRSRFFLSLQDVNISGTVPKDKNHRDAFRLNGSRDFGRLTVSYSADYTVQHSNTTPGSFSVNTGPSTTASGFGGSYYQNRAVYWTLLNTPASVDLRDYRNWRTDPFANPNGYFNAYYGNPWWQIDESRFDSKRNTLLGNISLSYKVTDWFNLAATAAITRYDLTQKFTSENFTFADWAKADAYGSGRSTTDQPATDYDAFEFNQRLTGNFFANFDKRFKEFSAKLVLGATTFDETQRDINTSAAQLVIPDFYNISNRVGSPNVYENMTEYRKIGAFADLTLGYHDYLFVHGSFRKDWDSRLDPSLRSYSYPAGDVSFVFTDAITALKNSTVFSYGKLSAAIGKTGNVSVGPYSLDNVFNTAPNFPYGGTAGFTVSNALNNRLIKPEFTTEKQIAVDLGFLRNRITLKAAVYQSNTVNQTLPVQVSSTTGFTSALLNSGEMRNRGVEIDLNVTPVNSRSGLKWDIGTNFAYNENKVLSLYPGIDNFLLPGSTTQYVVKGSAFPQIKVADWKRDPEGRIIVDKNSGFPTPNDSLSTFGTPNPPYIIGLHTQVSYKGFTLSVLAEGRFGAVIYNSLGNALDFTGVSAYSTQSGRQPFVIPNSSYLDGTGKYVANTDVVTKNGNNDFWASTWNNVGSTYINSADFWKIREVSLSYVFPKGIFGNKSFVKALSVALV
ncbi:MAG: SusC/RagA family TonB-linked outer membrane protein, partial [Bacteroidota bacterium]|nr:SusC/RagA family TonB-linked outer membrane protein [Bacteroidota bacterium]